jgi:hypothetical protein
MKMDGRKKGAEGAKREESDRSLFLCAFCAFLRPFSFCLQRTAGQRIRLFIADERYGAPGPKPQATIRVD